MGKKIQKIDRRYGNKDAGRKKVQDKKMPVQVYIRASEIDLLGGVETARHIALMALISEINKKN